LLYWWRRPVPLESLISFKYRSLQLQFPNTIIIIIIYKDIQNALAFAKRDLTFLSVTDAPLTDGTWVSGSVSVQTDQWLPREAGYTRAFQDSIAFYKPLNGNTETDITIVCRIDLNDSEG
jgi:hypothetical protein